MKLDRNINGTGRGKYGLINNRKLTDLLSHGDADVVASAVLALELAGVIEWGEPGTEGEFFVIKLRDAYAGGALYTYAQYAVHVGDIEYGQDVFDLAKRSGEFSPFCKKPD